MFLLNQQQILPVVKFRNDYTNFNSKYLEIVIVSKLPDFITSGIAGRGADGDKTPKSLAAETVNSALGGKALEHPSYGS